MSLGLRKGAASSPGLLISLENNVTLRTQNPVFEIPLFRAVNRFNNDAELRGYYLQSAWADLVRYRLWGRLLASRNHPDLRAYPVSLRPLTGWKLISRIN